MAAGRGAGAVGHRRGQDADCRGAVGCPNIVHMCSQRSYKDRGIAA